MGGPGRLPWRAPAWVVYIPGVSLKPGAEAGSRPSPAVPGQSPVKICWRTIARKAAAPRPRPGCSGAGSLPSAPRPLAARLASWTDVPDEGATRGRCPRPRHRGRSPHRFLPSLDARNVKEGPRAHPPTPPSAQAGPPNLRPGRPPTPQGPPPSPPETKRKKEHGEITFVFGTRARAHTHAHLPSGLPSWPGHPRPGVALNTPLAFQDLKKAPYAHPLAFPNRTLRRVSRGNSHTNNLTAPPPPIYKSVCFP